MRDVIAGRGLGELLDDVVAAWAAGAWHLLDGVRKSRSYDVEAWRRVAEAVGAERAEILLAQRLLIRRAGAGVPSRVLWMPPPLVFAPEDIPKRKLENARWFRAMKSHIDLLACLPGYLPTNLHQLASFISRHALVIVGSTELGYDRRARIQQVLDCVRAIGAYPRRSTSRQQFVAAVDDWHHRIAQAKNLLKAAQLAGKPIFDEQGRALVLREPPCPGWQSGVDEVVPLRRGRGKRG